MIQMLRHSIKARFIIITVGIVLTVVFVLTSATALTSARLLKEESERQLSQSLSQCAEMLSEFMKAREVSLDIWSSNPLTDAVFGDPALAMVFVPSLREYFSKIREKEPWISNIFLIEAEEIVYNDSDAFEFSEDSDGNPRGMKMLLSAPEKGIFAANLNQFNSELNKDVIIIKRRVVKNGIAAAPKFIVLMLDMETMNNRLFGKIQIGRRGFISMAAQNISGDMAVAKPAGAESEKQYFSEAAAQWKKFSDIPNRYRSIVLRKQLLRDYSLTLIGAASVNDIREAVSYLVSLSVIMSLLASGFGVWSAVFFSDKVTSPVFKLIHTIRLISEGDMNQRVDVNRQDEIGMLASVFNEMADRLQENHLALKEAEKKYRGIFKNAVEGIFQIRPDGSVVNLNPSMAKMMGYNSPEDMLASGYKITDQTYVNPEHRRQLLDIIKREGRIIGFETQFLRKDNTAIWVSLSARIVTDGGGKALYTEGSAIDITEHKEKEEAELQRQIAEEANKKIMSSIQYAKSIQDSLLPNISEVKKFLPESFFIWEPRDIVGGDIFFAEKLEDGFIIAVLDCTGHGVPGAFMTMIASSGLRKIIRDERCHDPAEILKRLNAFVKGMLHQDTKYALSDDGLDAAVCFVSRPDSQFSILNSQFPILTFSGAKMPLYYVHKGEINVIKGDRESIGYRRSDLNFDFTAHTVSIESGMSFYLFTDGFTDQMGGGEKRRRFGTARFKNLLREISAEPFEKQRRMLTEAYDRHRGAHHRQDDVTGIGFGLK
jgi:PAS domain S-box-containing protein